MGDNGEWVIQPNTQNRRSFGTEAGKFIFVLIVVVVNETTNVIKITKFKSEGVADAVGFVTPLC